MKKRIIAVALSMIMAFSAISQPYTSYATDQETEMLSTSTEDAIEESSTVASSESTEESSTAASSESAEEPSPSASPEASEEPSPSASPEASEEPGPSASPEASEEPSPPASPETSEEPSPPASPEASEEPSPPASPETSEEPSPSASPEASEEPSPSASPLEEASSETIVLEETTESIQEEDVSDKIVRDSVIFGSTSEMPKVGDQIWIKYGSVVYKNIGDQKGHTLILDYEVTITDIVTDESGNAFWYKFEFSNLGFGEWVLRNYKYVKTEDTLVEKPTEPDTPGKECNCENPPENLADHEDSCPRKATIKALTESKTSQELYDTWENYTEVERTDILNYLKGYDNVKFEELSKLLNPEDVNNELQSSVLSIGEGNNVNALWDNSVFGGVSAKMTGHPVDISEEISNKVSDAIKSSLGSNVTILKLISTDITFVDEAGISIQPLEDKNVSLDFNISNEQIPEGANKIVIVHIYDDGTAEVVGEKYLDTDAEIQSVLVSVPSFSTYVTALVNSKYQSTLLRDFLGENHARYEVRSLYEVAGVKVNLFDYDPKVFNTGKTINDSFVFLGIEGWTSVTNGGVNDSSAEYANQGILKEELNTNGIPEMAFGGITTGGHLFNPYDTTGRTGRAAYPDVDFEFVYDKVTHNYIYSSAHNHAQLADDHTKVQLYTDTLAVINNKVTDISLSGDRVTSPNDCTLSYANNQITGLINNSNGDRTDPYFTLKAENFVPYQEDKVVVRIRFNFNADGKPFWLYFNRSIDDKIESSNDDRTLKGTYTNGKNVDGWYEYEVVLDASENANWTDYKIANFRIDPIDSQDGYVMGSNDQFVLESINVIRGLNETKNSNLNGGFYPFSKIEDSYPGQNDTFNLEEWEQQISNAQGTDYKQGTRAIYNGTTNGDNIDHLYMGLSAVLPFYIPESKLIDDKEIVYTFNGDDDLWVFIAGKLVLDIGGGHGAIKGTINFTTGVVEVENAITVTGLTSGDYTAPSKRVKNFTFEPGEHVMQLFYMERAGSVSNCFMKFNFPIIPVSSFTVSKEVEKTSQEELYMPMEDEEFTFSLSAKTPTHEDQDVDVSKWTYTLWGAGETGEKTYSPINGQIKLKRGQTARFENVDEQTEITVTEIAPSQYSGSCEYNHTTVKINDEEESKNTTCTVTTTASASQNIVFTNFYKDRFFDLTIQKKGCNEVLDSNQSFIFRVRCEETGVDTNVAVCGNDEFTIKQLRFGEYTITENDSWSWRYAPEGGKLQTINATEDSHNVTFSNTRNNDLWLDGNSFIQNLFTGFSSQQDNTSSN